MRESHQHSEHHETRNQRKTAVADERQSDTGHRQCAGDAAHIDQRLKTDERRQARRAQFAEHIS